MDQGYVSRAALQKLERILTKVQTAENIKGLRNRFYIKSAILYWLSINVMKRLPSIFDVDYTWSFNSISSTD